MAPESILLHLRDDRNEVEEIGEQDHIRGSEI